MLEFAHPTLHVIPGRAEGANPESSGKDRLCIWIPGSLAEPVIGPAKGRTRWLAMTLIEPLEDCRRHCEERAARRSNLCHALCALRSAQE